MNAIEAKGLTKRYGAKTAVDHVDIAVQEGELFALLGVNGAGKTTLIRLLSCLSTPTEGEGMICGLSCTRAREQVKALIGLSPQDTAVSEHLTVWENLCFMAGALGHDRAKARQRAESMIRDFHMENVQNQQACTLSGGWKRKLSIAMALIGQPRVLFLDEPTLGLDVLARRELWHSIRALKSKTTILLTTHYMEEAEQLADRLAILLDGRIAALGTLAELEEQTGRQGLEEVFVAIARKGADDE